MSITTGISSNEPWIHGAIADAPAVTLLDVGSHPHTWLIPYRLYQVHLFMAVDRGLP